MGISQKFRRIWNSLSNLETAISLGVFLWSLGGAAILSIVLTIWGYIESLPGPYLVIILIFSFGGVLWAINQVLVLKGGGRATVVAAPVTATTLPW